MEEICGLSSPTPGELAFNRETMIFPRETSFHSKFAPEPKAEAREAEQLGATSASYPGCCHQVFALHELAET